MIKCAVLAIKKWWRFGKITFILKDSGVVLVKKRGRFGKKWGRLGKMWRRFGSRGVLTCIHFL